MQAVAKLIVPDWGDRIDSGRVVFIYHAVISLLYAEHLTVKGWFYGANIWLGLSRFRQAA
jgi:hypothetical protein